MSPLLIIFLVFLFNAVRVLGLSVFLGDSVILSASQSCGDGEQLKLTHLLKDDRPKEMGAVVNGVWMTEKEYKDRLVHISNRSFNLTNINYNDKGLYEFTCAGRVLLPLIQLDVFVLYEVETDGKTAIKLNFHFVTAGEHDVNFISLERNKTRVAGMNLSSGEVSYGTGSEGAVSVSPDWFSHGDLSLIIKKPQPKDQGDYFMTLQEKDGKTRDAAAVRLKFKERNSGSVSKNTSSQNIIFSTTSCKLVM